MGCSLHVTGLHPFDLPSSVMVTVSDFPVLYCSPPTCYVLHPRWCLECLNQRTLALEQGLEERLTHLPLPIVQRGADGERDWESGDVDEEVKIRAKRAYLMGVFAGRIEALSVSLEELTEERELYSPVEPNVSTTPSTLTLEGDAELVDMLLDLRIGEEDERMEDLTQRMQQVQVDFDEFNHDFALAFLEFDEEVVGRRDGRNIQGMLEDGAANIDIGAEGRSVARGKALL
jgi:hypothetical protein